MRASTTITLTCLCALACAPSAAAKEQLIPAQYRTRTDGGGFRWDIDSSGRVNISRMGQVNQLTVNGSSFRATNRLMTQDQLEMVFQGRASSYTVTRRIRVKKKSPGVRCVDLVMNPGARPVTVTVTYRHRINMNNLPIVDEHGKAVGSLLGPKSTGLLAAGTSGVSALFSLCGKRSKIRPTITKRHNYELQISYRLTIPPQKSAAICYTIAQQNLAGTTVGKAQAKLFKEFQKGSWTRDLPKPYRKAIKNMRGGVSTAGPVTILSLEEELGLAETNVDLLAFGEETLLRGTASCGKLVVESAYGKSTVPFAKVSAIVGGAHRSGHTRLHFRDGQRLSGSLTAEGMKFTMTTGVAVDLSIDRLDRLVLRASSDDVKVQPAGRLLVETHTGDRLLVKTPKELKLTFATRWGMWTVGMDRIRSLQLIGEGQPGYWVTLNDKSRFRAFMAGSDLVLDSTLFGRLTFHPSDIRAMVASDILTDRAKSELDIEDITQPHLTLVGGDVLVGQIDLSTVHFASTGEVIPVPPSQIRVLSNGLEGEAPELGKGIPFKAEIWGGGEVSGELRECVLPIQTPEGKFRIPTRDILTVMVPTPQIPPALRRKMAGMIRQLGDASWEKREAATRELKSLGALAKLPLEEAGRQTKDPEIKRRVKDLLEAIKE